MKAGCRNEIASRHASLAASAYCAPFDETQDRRNDTMKIVTSRIHPTLPIFRLATGEWHVLYTPPGHLVVVEPAIAETIQNAWECNAVNVKEKGGGTTALTRERDRQPEEATARQVAYWLQDQ